MIITKKEKVREKEKEKKKNVKSAETALITSLWEIFSFSNAALLTARQKENKGERGERRNKVRCMVTLSLNIL